VSGEGGTRPGEENAGISELSAIGDAKSNAQKAGKVSQDSGLIALIRVWFDLTELQRQAILAIIMQEKPN
jgi:hypothetical protein